MLAAFSRGNFFGLPEICPRGCNWSTSWDLADLQSPGPSWVLRLLHGSSVSPNQFEPQLLRSTADHRNCKLYRSTQAMSLGSSAAAARAFQVPLRQRIRSAARQDLSIGSGAEAEPEGRRAPTSAVPARDRAIAEEAAESLWAAAELCLDGEAESRSGQPSTGLMRSPRTTTLTRGDATGVVLTQGDG